MEHAVGNRCRRCDRVKAEASAGNVSEVERQSAKQMLHR